MPELTVTIGLPGSGKTTWAREQVRSRPPGQVVRVNRDCLRGMLHDGLHLGTVPPNLNTATEAQVTIVQRATVDLLFQFGAYQVIIDDTNMHIATLSRWYAFARSHGIDLGVRSFLDVSVETCVERDLGRGKEKVGEEVIRDMHERHGFAAQQWYEMACDGLEPPCFKVVERS